MKMPLSRYAVPILARMGRFGDWLLHRLGWVTFRNETRRHAHASDCVEPRPALHLRPQGWVKRCETCQMPVEIHFAFWETDQGHVPPEVVLWLVEETKVIARLEGILC
jgi:hypothetical protein